MKCKMCNKCRYYSTDHYTCEKDDGYGCGVLRDWDERTDQLVDTGEMDGVNNQERIDN